MFIHYKALFPNSKNIFELNIYLSANCKNHNIRKPATFHEIIVVDWESMGRVVTQTRGRAF